MAAQKHISTYLRGQASTILICRESSFWMAGCYYQKLGLQMKKESYYERTIHIFSKEGNANQEFSLNYANSHADCRRITANTNH